MDITHKDLMEAGVHFGHQLRRWNPRSRPFVYTNRQGLSIIDLEKTFNALKDACEYLEEVVASGKNVLFVGTKKQAQEPMREAATATNMPFCVNRWMGGCLTNFATIKTSLEKYKRYLEMESSGELAKRPGKEAAAIRREMSRMHRNFEGLINTRELPAVLFVVDIKSEQIAVAEARRLGIPVVALVDTNSDPSLVDHPIPGNDDSVKSIRIIVDTITRAIEKGLEARQSRMSEKPISSALRQEADQSGEKAEVKIAPELVAHATPAKEEAQPAKTEDK